MGLFERLFGSRKERVQADQFFKMLNAYTPVFTNWSGKIYESELVRSAINAKASHISKMSVKVYGSAKPSLQTKLKAAPNEFQTWSQFLYRLDTILETNTTAYILPVIDEYDSTTGIYCALPQNVEFVQYKEKPFIRYRFGTGQTAVIEMERCGIMTRFQYRNEFTGDGNAALGDTMALVNMQSQAIKEGMKSSASFRFMAQLTNFSKTEDLVKERKRFTAENLSASDGGILLFPNNYGNIQQISSKPFVADAEQMKVIQTNVYNYFGVNEKIMQNSATAEELDAFFEGSLEPFAIQLSEVLTKMLFTLREQNIGNRVHVSSDRLQYMSVANKVSLIQTLGDRGMISTNEARALLSYPPIDGGDDMLPMRGEYTQATTKLENGDEDG